MYTLYFLPDACSLATQVVLRELGQDFTLIDKRRVDNYAAINPTGAVPALSRSGQAMTEGAAILLYLLKQHSNTLLPENPASQQRAIEQLLFANATMHPAYSRLFFIEQQVEKTAKPSAFTAATEAINRLWRVVEQQLQGRPFLAGKTPGAADILLAVYARWGEYFPVAIEIGQARPVTCRHRIQSPFRTDILKADFTAIAQSQVGLP